MKKRTLGLIALLAIGVLTLTGCNKTENTEDEVIEELENPELVEETLEEEVEDVNNDNPAASIYCEENGGTLMPREDEEGNKFSLCVFSNGIACEIWSFYRGECQPGELSDNTSNNEVVEEVAPVIEEEVVDEDVATAETVIMDTENE